MSQAKTVWRCQMPNCGYIYDPDRGDKKSKIPPGIFFENFSGGWRCPVCKASKRSFLPSSSFAKLKKNEEAGSTLNAVLEKIVDSLTAEDYKAAGDVFFAMGDRNGAEKMFKQAAEKLHS